MVVSGPLSYSGQNFTRCSYSSVNFDDDAECRGCGRYRKKCKDVCKTRLVRVTLLTLKVVIVINIVLFVVIPLIFKFSYSLQRKAVFLNFVNLPKSDDYSDPQLFGIDGARNFYLDHNGVKLGVWQILSSNSISNSTTDLAHFEAALANGQDVILYNHGNSGSRATAHRIELYKFLRNFFHVIAYDYRGFGDSSDDLPTEQDVVNDSIFMVQWLRSKIAPSSNFFIWGHSLGTSITLSTVQFFKKRYTFLPTGIILEAPFNNLRDEIGEFPLTLLFRHLPWFEFCIVDPLGENGFLFESDKYILNVDSPILILHAEDDRTVPYKLGKKLYEKASENRLDTQGSLQLETFPGRFHYGHKYIVRAPELHDIIDKFIKNAINETNALQL